jgi:hypothetical protein
VGVAGTADQGAVGVGGSRVGIDHAFADDPSGFRLTPEGRGAGMVGVERVGGLDLPPLAALVYTVNRGARRTPVAKAPSPV